MKRILLIILLIAGIAIIHAETYTQQSFEATTVDTWSCTAVPDGMTRLFWWGTTDQPMGGASAQSGAWYWGSWDLDNVESSLTFPAIALPIGYTYTLSFYYYTNGLVAPGEYSKYSVAYDNGTQWTNWTTLTPDTDAWTQVSLALPAYASQVRLKVAASHNGFAKYAHWDAFSIARTAAPPAAPLLYNTSVAQRTDGSGLVDIYYDVFDTNGDNSTVSLQLSADNGASFTLTPAPANLSGDFGASITNGTSKHIIWNAKAEAVDFDNNQYKLLITAEDNSYPPVAEPVFTPGAGVYTSTQNVTITCATPGAEIRYTTDGSEPTESSALYSSPIYLNHNKTLKAKAFKSAWMPSTTSTAVYTIPVPTNFTLVPGGMFTMGDTRDNSDPLPLHSVTISTFIMGKYEVTQGEYQTIMGSNPASDYGVGATYPVHYVNWYSAIKYCNLRSMNEGLTPVYTISGSTNPTAWGTVPTSGNATWDAAICNWTANGYRLPTEAEWEFAARGGTATPDYLYSGSDDINAVAWYAPNAGSTSHPVGTKAANALGIFDMTGNVWEWCWDRWGAYSSTPQTNPQGAVSGSYRLFRGGYWGDNVTYCRITGRHYNPNYNIFNIGFRVCRAVW